MSLVKLMPKRLIPDLCPGVGRWSFAIIVLVESVLPVSGIDYFKAIEGVNSLIPFGLMAIAQNHAKRVVDAVIIPLDFFHRQRVSTRPPSKLFLHNHAT